jgi:hypothetical protein
MILYDRPVAAAICSAIGNIDSILHSSAQIRGIQPSSPLNPNTPSSPLFGSIPTNAVTLVIIKLLIPQKIQKVAEDLLNSLTKRVQDMTKEEFEQLPVRDYSEDIGVFDSLIILPRDEMDDSGYRCMAFVACAGDQAICLIGGGSDVIHVDGIGGMGQWGFMKFHKTGKVPPLADAWSIDCLSTSGLMRLFAVPPYSLRAGVALSSFEIFSVAPHLPSNTK